MLYPPLRAHISKRDTRSFFLHWIPNPLNEHRTILGYRIYIDNQLKGTIDSGQFEAIVDYIRDEGEYRIKIRAYNQYHESTDSNVVTARFTRHHTATAHVDSNPTQSSAHADIHQCSTNDYIINQTDSIEQHEHLVNLLHEQTRTPIVLNHFEQHGKTVDNISSPKTTERIRVRRFVCYD
jgi:hypothetical protein